MAKKRARYVPSTKGDVLEIMKWSPSLVPHYLKMSQLTVETMDDVTVAMIDYAVKERALAKKQAVEVKRIVSCRGRGYQRRRWVW